MKLIIDALILEILIIFYFIFCSAKQCSSLLNVICLLGLLSSLFICLSSLAFVSLCLFVLQLSVSFVCFTSFVLPRYIIWLHCLGNKVELGLAYPLGPNLSSLAPSRSVSNPLLSLSLSPQVGPLGPSPARLSIK